jgi:hypothetical protein
MLGEPGQQLGMLVGGIVVRMAWVTLRVGTDRSTVAMKRMNS